ncbi:hypothetical protein DL93DRAFT_410226 [Clavulina sp. PMI_390]|nr:hypothetical protein DL93DRAFT_410226 [Clavulina sp. PMI_390]
MSSANDEVVDEQTAREVERTEGDSDTSGDYVPGTDATQATYGEDTRDAGSVEPSDEAFDADVVDDSEEMQEFEEADVGDNGGTDGLTNRQIGGLKATLKNPRVSEEAKENAAEKLRTAGVNA